MDIVVEIADLNVSNDTETHLLTYSLGSCIGVSIWDPVANVGGLLHYMLPDSGADPDRASATPAMFCDTGVPLLFQRAFELGAEKSRLAVSVVGGSQLLDERGAFNVGKRNYIALRKLFWKNSVKVDKEHVGGFVSRTMKLNVATGVVTVTIQGEEVEL